MFTKHVESSMMNDSGTRSRGINTWTFAGRSGNGTGAFAFGNSADAIRGIPMLATVAAALNAEA
jgi:hypothetical protein